MMPSLPIDPPVFNECAWCGAMVDMRDMARIADELVCLSCWVWERETRKGERDDE